MSEGETRIVCRSCGETISLATGNCPHCGTSIRGTVGPVVAIVIGAVLAVAALAASLWFFIVVGLVIAGIGGFLLHDRRRRMNEAHAPGDEEAASESVESSA